MPEQAALRVGFVGAGRRVREIYLPALTALRREFEVVGFASRHGASAREFAVATGTTAYVGAAELATAANVDLIVVAVGAQANAGVAIEAIATGRAVLLETPIGLTPADGHRVVRAAARSASPIGIAEQKAFLPWEVFKRQLIASGALGRVVVVENDYRSTDYHAMAQLRMMLPSGARPILAQATRLVTPLAHQAPAGMASETWTVGTVAFDDGSLITHRSTTAYARTPFRTFRSLRVYGTRGSLVNQDISVLDGEGRTVTVAVRTWPGGGDAPARIECVLPGDVTVTWSSPAPAAALSDDQIGVAHHLIGMAEAIRHKTAVPYGPHQALLDVEMADALTASTRRSGAPVVIDHRCADAACVPRRRPAVARQRLAMVASQFTGSRLARRAAARVRQLGWSR